MSDEPPRISEADFKILEAVKNFPTTSYFRKVSHHTGLGSGWVNSVDIRESSQSGSLETRAALERLAAARLVFVRTINSSRHYNLTPAGERFLDQPSFVDDSHHSNTWTGVVNPVQVVQCLTIVSEMEDVCERMHNNLERAQIYGLVRALEALLNVPEPPRSGIVTLVRDPAFNNIVQVGTFLAALIAAVKA